jgi:hypothetical protein
MFKPRVFALLLISLCVTAPSFAETDITMHQVYLAASAGKFAEAQSMMDKVLREHPNSAKAHFVEAELLAKQGQFNKAANELTIAEGLQPGLPFAKPEAVQELRSKVSTSSSNVTQPNNYNNADLASGVAKWLPTILLFIGLAFIIWLIRFMMQRNSRAIPSNKYNYAGNNATQNTPPIGAGSTNPMTGQTTGGMGSGLMGSLATGAALGAGVVAGEALMHHFVDGHRVNNNPETSSPDTSPWGASNVSDNNDGMGGNDFGITDDSSWDDSSSDYSDDDWT